jgi:hypothetical protein
MVALVRPSIFAQDVVEMGRSRVPPPQHVIGWKLAILTDSAGDVDISYLDSWAFDMAPGENIDKYIKEYAGDPDKVRGKPPSDPYPNKSKSNLSIRHDAFSYMVFILHNKNLQFCEGNEAFRVERNNADYYTDPLCAWDVNGAISTGRIPGARCRVASFLANSAADQAASTMEFFTSFNIYLDMRLKRKDDESQIRTLPIVIDPDVGYPGGNQP